MYDIRSGYLQDAAIYFALYTRKDDEVFPMPSLVERAFSTDPYYGKENEWSAIVTSLSPDSLLLSARTNTEY